MATVTTLSGQVYLVMNPVGLAEVLRGPGGPVVRDLIVRGERVKVRMKQLCPVRTGNMRDHIVKRIVEGKGGEPNCLIGIEKVPYAVWVVKGSQPHDIYPVNARVLAWQGSHGDNPSLEREMTGDWIYAHHVHHPGNKPNPFMYLSLAAAA